MIVDVEESPIFTKAVKKLHTNQKVDLNEAVKAIRENPLVGEAKVGDLNGYRVLKSRTANQLTLPACKYEEGAGRSRTVLKLVALGSHGNFYRDLKNRTP